MFLWTYSYIQYMEQRYTKRLGVADCGDKMNTGSARSSSRDYHKDALLGQLNANKSL